MGKKDDRLARRIEAQIAGVQRRLAGDVTRRPRWGGFLGGLALGTFAGAVLAYLASSRGEEESIPVLPERDDAILLRERSQPSSAGGAAPLRIVGTADEAAPDRVPAAPPPSAPVEGAPEPVADPPADQLAAAELEDAQALTEIAEQVDAEPPAPAPSEAETPPAPVGVEPVNDSCPESHPIKGNHSSSGDHIFHVPGSRNYGRTKPEVCFATEADAEAAGYRAPRG